MSRRILGLEISNTAVAGAVINSGIKGSFVESHARVKLAGVQDFDQHLASALDTLAKSIDITGTTCIASIPAGWAFFRHLSLPFRDESKLRQILPYELETLLPYPVEDLIVDYIPAGPGSGDDSDLIAAAVRKSTIAALLAVLGPQGIDPATITVGGFATAICLAGTTEPTAEWVLADADGRDLSLFFARAGALIYSRTTRSPENDQNANGTGLAAQINRSLRAYQDIHNPAFAPEVLFSGDPALLGAASPGTDPHTASLPVKPIDLAGKIDLPSLAVSKHSEAAAPEDNALALGYLEWSGLRGVDFRRGPFEKKKQWRQHRGSMLRSGLLVLVVLAMAFAGVMVDNYTLGKRIGLLDHEIETIFKSALPAVTRIVDPLQQLRVEVQASQQSLALPQDDTARLRVIDLLQALSTGIPARTDVALMRVVIGRDNILVSGHTDTFNAVDDIKSGLEKAPAFKQVTISSANLQKSGNRVNFKLKVQL